MKSAISILILCGSLVAVAVEPNLDDPSVRSALVKEAATQEEANQAGPAFSGWVKTTHDDGSISELFERSKGARNGRSVCWNKDGRKVWEGQFKDGEQMGKWTYWTAGGRVTTRTFTEKEVEERAKERAGRERRGHRISPHLIAMFDADGDGVLNEEEKAEAGASRQRRAKRSLARKLEEFDKDGDGKVSFAEEYAEWDQDGDGKLNAAEMKVARADRKQQHAMKLAADCKLYDRDGDGKVTSKERIAAYDMDEDGKLNAIERAKMKRDYEYGR